MTAAQQGSKETILAQILDMPWKLRNELRRLLSLPWIRLRFAAAGVRWQIGWRIYGTPILQRHRLSSIVLGPRVELRSFAGSNPLSPNHPVVLSTRQAGAVIHIGEGFGMTGGCIVANCEVRIGDRVMIGANSMISDTDFHPLEASLRRDQPTAGSSSPIHIGDDVFIGAQCIVLKGVSIGAGTVVGAGSVVTQSLPAGVIAGGCPARVLRAI